MKRKKWVSSLFKSGRNTKNNSFQYEMDEASGCLFIKHSGTITFDLSMSRTKELREKVEGDKNLNRLIDFRSSILNISENEVDEFINSLRIDREGHGYRKEAFIINNELSHGIIRIMAEMLGGMATEFKIFHSDDPNLEENVKDWLELNSGSSLPKFISL